jgi:phospholipid/cholesterol/gamma-HCH transport system substrate-binding protein
MNTSRLQWKVGLFVFIGLVLLALLMVQFSKGLSLGRSTYDILLRAQTAGSLKIRSQVLMSGVEVGTVSDIRLAPSGKFVTITLKLYRNYKVFKTARFAIEQIGFLGDEYVAILPTENTGEAFRDGDPAEAEAPFNMLEVARAASGLVKRIDDMAQRLNDTVVDMRQYLLNQETLTNLAVSAANLRLASERAINMVNNLDLLLTTNAPALAGTGTNLSQFSRELISFAERLNGLLATNTPSINQSVKNVESSTATLKSALDQVESGQGLAGALIKNDKVALSLEEISHNLTITTSNLNRLGLWGIFWQHKPAKSEETPREPVTSPKARGS